MTCILTNSARAFDLLNHRYVLVDKGSLQSFIDGTCFAAGEEAN